MSRLATIRARLAKLQSLRHRELVAAADEATRRQREIQAIFGPQIDQAQAELARLIDNKTFARANL